MKQLLGLDIGGTKCAVCIGTVEAQILGRREIPTEGSPEEILNQLARQGKELVVEHGPVEAIGISCGGPLDANRGVVQSPPNLPGWDEIPVTDFFVNEFNLPALLKNDANAGALAEWMYGAGKGTRNMMFCTMGTGFGCGLILDGKLFEGSNGNAGELGHVRLTEEGPTGYNKAGSVEGWCSGGGIAQLVNGRMDARELAEAAQIGDSAALRIFAGVGEHLGMALSIAVDLLNVERIVLGSIFARQEALIRPSMELVMAREALPEALKVCEVKPALLGERIGDVAALAVAHLGMEEG
jgi:glucokinase